MRLDYSQPVEALEMLKESLGVEGFNGPHYWLAVRSAEEEILATFLFSQFGPSGCEMSAAIFRLIPSRDILRDVFSYPFLVLRHRRLTVVVKETNHRSLRNVEGLGFKVEGLVRDWFPECNGILFGMTKGECKWLAAAPHQHNQTQS